MPDLGFVFLLFLAACLYTSVGHAGGSGYLAIMALYNIAPETMRPAALMLNIIAAIPTVWQFHEAGHFDRRLFFALAIGSVPLAFFGSPFQLPYALFRWIVASALLLAAIRLVIANRRVTQTIKKMPIWLGPIVGAPIGLLAGLTGIGGGVYLTPILLFANWAEPKKAAGVSAAFILVNSLAGATGQFPKIIKLGPDVPIWAIVVLMGALIGSRLGSTMIAITWLRRLLAIVLIFATIKLIFV
jgi:uncharacterized protein